MSEEDRSEMDDELRPFDFLAVGVPDGEITGSGLAMLLDLADRGVMPVLSWSPRTSMATLGQWLL
jgi:hypothetical protein